MAAYEAGLGGATVWVRTGRDRRPLPLQRWTGEADERDAGVVAAVLDGTAHGARVLDVGCGPGRLTAALAGRGVVAVGVDLSGTAVALARARGVQAHRADVLRSLPPGWAGRWDRVLLADGNLGIGGDPVALLRRVRPLLAPGGRLVAAVRPSGGLVRSAVRIETRDALGNPLGGPMPWAWVGADAARDLGAAAGLVLRRVQDRIAVWELP